MKIHHLRNATMIITIGEHRLLVDPMLCEPGTLPGFKLFGGGRQANPLVALPTGADTALNEVSGVLITHEHPDHLDPTAMKWIKIRDLPVWAGSDDVPNLEKKGLNVKVLQDPTLGMAVEVIPAQHGRGLIGWMMGPVSGFYLAHPKEPSIFITGDAVLTDTVSEAVTRLKPDVIIAPAGAANFGVGDDILFSTDELVKLVKSAPGEVVLNHLEAVDHCPTTRLELRKRMTDEGLSARVHIPENGDTLEFKRQHTRAHARPKASPATSPGFQKWLTAWFTGT